MESKEGVVMENENAKIELDFSVGKQGEMGPQGPQGPQGEPGADGADGKSAYQVAVDNGFEGSEAEWLESLKGKDAEGGATPSGLIEVTQTELFRLRDNSLLIVGQEYKVIDYVSHYDEYNATSAKHPYDLIIRANGVSSWCENAKASIHEGDTYFAQNDLTKWELKVDSNLKVVWLKDEYENEAPFDFKNVLWEGFFYTFSLVSTEGTIADCSLVQYKCYRNRLMHKVDITDIADKQIYLVLIISTQTQNSISNNYIVREEFNNIAILGAGIYNNIILGGIINIATMMGSIDNNTFIDSRVVVNSQIQDEGINFEYSTVIGSGLVIQGGLLKTTIVSSEVRVEAQNIDTYTLKVYGNKTTYKLNYTNNPDMPTTGDVFLKPDGSAWVGDKVQWYEKYYREKENQWVEVTDFTKPFLVEGVRNYILKKDALMSAIVDDIGKLITEDFAMLTLTEVKNRGGVKFIIRQVGNSEISQIYDVILGWITFINVPYPFVTKSEIPEGDDNQLYNITISLDAEGQECCFDVRKTM